MMAGRGYSHVGLTVELSNPRAQRLYQRLGYRDWGHGTYLDRWTEHDVNGYSIAHQDPGTYLLKRHPTSTSAQP